MQRGDREFFQLMFLPRACSARAELGKDSQGVLDSRILSALIRFWERKRCRRPYSADIRGRVIASVESGSSRREAAEEFDVSASSAIKWVAAYRTTGSCAAKPRGGSTSPLEKYANFLLTLIEGQPDLTLDEVVCAMRKRKLSGSRTDASPAKVPSGDRVNCCILPPGSFVAAAMGLTVMASAASAGSLALPHRRVRSRRRSAPVPL